MGMKYWEGKKHSEETKKKISETKKRNFKDGITIPSKYWLGKQRSKEFKKQISIKTKGKNNPNYKNALIKKQCLFCNNEFNTYKSKDNKFCSTICYFKNMKGRKLSKEIRKKISIGHKGIKFSEEHKRKIGLIHKNKIVSKETRLKLSIAQQGKYELDKNPAWLGGISFEPYTLDFNKRFKESIRERDNYCCIICNKHEEELNRKLSIHHIDYNKLNSFKQNCLSLCLSCHTKTNLNRTQWKIFFQSLLKERYGYKYSEDQKIILDFTNEEIK